MEMFQNEYSAMDLPILYCLYRHRELKNWEHCFSKYI